ncbi:MAG: hypothetical protein A2033_01205 [Bacteroidetes bacterium GWA2_31_9]|nr:MAG: hypothetical protein A2033_01205 [Bacteroidetes bacterium GWA2_31_9]
MKIIQTLIVSFLFANVALAQELDVVTELDTTAYSEVTNLAFCSDSTRKYICSEVLFKNDSIYRRLIRDSIITANFWDTVPQPNYWRKLINLPADSALMNESSSRIILDKIHVSFYNKKTPEQKAAYRDSLRREYCLDDSCKILFSSGKKFFYDFKNAIPNIDASLPVFISNKVDPWYAQSILLIESPNKLQKSNVGAYGPYQLMKYVARKYGLQVNKYVDERKDVKRSAYAASKFIKSICIPSVKELLASYNIPYDESDLWFKLLVMHTYHAGSGNVKAVVSAINPVEGGFPLIYKVWQTRAGGFKNASQNYSQVLLAALMELNNYVEREASEIRMGVYSNLTENIP